MGTDREVDTTTLAAAVAGGTINTFTAASPVTSGAIAVGVYQNLMNTIQLLHINRFQPAQALIMTPTRWAYFMAFNDTQGRPLVVPNSSPVFNAFGKSDGDAAENYAGVLFGLPVYLDASISSTQGAGTEDNILIAKLDDVVLMEGDLQVEVFPQTLANSLAVFVRVYAYNAIVVKQVKGVYSLAGTGMKAIALGT